MKILHLGIPVQRKTMEHQYTYVEPIKLHVTNADNHEYKLQYVYPERESPLPESVKTENHLAIEVENIEDEIKNFDEILYPPVDVFGKMKICFVRKENIIFELTEFLN